MWESRSSCCWGATITESSTWLCANAKAISQFHGHVEDSVTVALYDGRNRFSLCTFY